MTSPVTCLCGGAVVRMSSCPGPMSICMSPGYVFEGEVQQINRLNGLAQDWPVGTTTRLRISWGTGTEMIVPGVVAGSYLRFEMTGAETEQIPRGALATIDVNYDAGDPDLWRPWRAGNITPCG